MSQLAAIKAGAEGKLDGLKPFGPVARGTLQGYLRQAMKDRKHTIKATPDELRAKLLAEVWEEVEVNIPSLKGEEKLKRVRQAAAAIDALERKPNRPSKPPKEEGDEEPEKPAQPPVAKPDTPGLDRLRAALDVPAQSDDSREPSDGDTAVAPDLSDAPDLDDAESDDSDETSDDSTGDNPEDGAQGRVL